MVACWKWSYTCSSLGKLPVHSRLESLFLWNSCRWTHDSLQQVLNLGASQNGISYESFWLRTVILSPCRQIIPSYCGMVVLGSEILLWPDLAEDLHLENGRLNAKGAHPHFVLILLWKTSTSSLQMNNTSTADSITWSWFFSCWWCNKMNRDFFHAHCSIKVCVWSEEHIVMMILLSYQAFECQ